MSAQWFQSYYPLFTTSDDWTSTGWKPGTVLRPKENHPNLESGEHGINGYNYPASMSMSYYNL